LPLIEKFGVTYKRVEPEEPEKYEKAPESTRKREAPKTDINKTIESTTQKTDMEAWEELSPGVTQKVAYLQEEMPKTQQKVTELQKETDILQERVEVVKTGYAKVSAKQVDISSKMRDVESKTVVLETRVEKAKKEMPDSPLLKALVTQEKLVSKITGPIRTKKEELLETAWEYKGTEKELLGGAMVAGAMTLSIGAGFIEGLTMPLRPLAVGSTVISTATLITSQEMRKATVESIKMDPIGFTGELTGGLIGGYAFTKVYPKIGKGISKIGSEIAVKTPGLRDIYYTRKYGVPTASLPELASDLPSLRVGGIPAGKSIIEFLKMKGVSTVIEAPPPSMPAVSGFPVLGSTIKFLKLPSVDTSIYKTTYVGPLEFFKMPSVDISLKKPPSSSSILDTKPPRISPQETITNIKTAEGLKSLFELKEGSPLAKKGITIFAPTPIIKKAIPSKTGKIDDSLYGVGLGHGELIYDYVPPTTKIQEKPGIPSVFDPYMHKTKGPLPQPYFKPQEIEKNLEKTTRKPITMPKIDIRSKIKEPAKIKDEETPIQISGTSTYIRTHPHTYPWQKTPPIQMPDTITKVTPTQIPWQKTPPIQIPDIITKTKITPKQEPELISPPMPIPELTGLPSPKIYPKIVKKKKRRRGELELDIFGEVRTYPIKKVEKMLKGL
jgi:hypothetical protein